MVVCLIAYVIFVPFQYQYPKKFPPPPQHLPPGYYYYLHSKKPGYYGNKKGPHYPGKQQPIHLNLTMTLVSL